MTGGESIAIDVEVYCGMCMDGEIAQIMKLTDDVEHSEGEYRCPKCTQSVTVSLRIGN